MIGKYNTWFIIQDWLSVWILWLQSESSWIHINEMHQIGASALAIFGMEDGGIAESE